MPNYDYLAFVDCFNIYKATIRIKRQDHSNRILQTKYSSPTHQAPIRHTGVQSRGGSERNVGRSITVPGSILQCPPSPSFYLIFSTPPLIFFVTLWRGPRGWPGWGGGIEEGWWLLEEFRNASSHTHAHTPYKDFISLSDCLHFSLPKQAQKCQHDFFLWRGWSTSMAQKNF